MELCHYLTPKNIVFIPKSKDKELILTELVKKLAELNDIRDVTELEAAIIKREQESSTFLPNGIAIPHARVPQVSEITMIMGVLSEGFTESEDAEKVHIIILFFSPLKDKEFGIHLKFLARVSSVFDDPNFVKELASIRDVDKLFARIQQKERNVGEQ